MEEMTPLERLQAELLDWETPEIAASLIQAQREELEDAIEKSGANSELRARLASQLVIFNLQESINIAKAIGYYKDAIALFLAGGE